MMSRHRWIYIEPQDPDPIEQIRRNRNYSSDFFEADLEHLPPETLLKDVDKATERIIDAVQKKEKILIFGDDDPDGITSTYLLFSFLELIGSQNHFYYIPNRSTDAFGIQPHIVSLVREQGFTLLITVDGGSSSVEGVESLKPLGCDVIITDHHIVPPERPDAYAMINPKQIDCAYPYKMVAGVGVVLLLIRYASRLLETRIPLSWYFWTMVGTIADKVPLNGVNRIICREVLNNWSRIEDPTVRFLMNYQPCDGMPQSVLNLVNYAYKILSSGRQPGGENRAMDFLLASSHDKSQIIQYLLEKRNDYESHVSNVIDYARNLSVNPEDLYLLLEDIEDRIPLQVLGMTASYLSSQHRIPVLILKPKGEHLVCEARSTAGFNLVKAFENCQEHLIQYGGHAQAAGFSIEPNLLSSFKECFDRYILRRKEDILDYRTIEIDAVITPQELDFSLHQRLEHFLPFGQGNPEPVFLMLGFRPDKAFYPPHSWLVNFDYEPGIEYQIVFSINSKQYFQVLDHRRATSISTEEKTGSLSLDSKSL